MSQPLRLSTTKQLALSVNVLRSSGTADLLPVPTAGGANTGWKTRTDESVIDLGLAFTNQFKLGVFSASLNWKKGLDLPGLPSEVDHIRTQTGSVPVNPDVHASVYLLDLSQNIALNPRFDLQLGAHWQLTKNGISLPLGEKMNYSTGAYFGTT